MWQGRYYIIATDYDSYWLTALYYEDFVVYEVMGKRMAEQDRQQMVNIAVKMRNMANFLSHS